MNIFDPQSGAGYIGGLHVVNAGNAWLSGAGEQYNLPDFPDVPTNGGGTGRTNSDFPTLPQPQDSPSPSPPSSPSPPPSPPEQPQTQQQPQQQTQQQPSVVGLFSQLRGMLGGTSYTPSSPVVLLSPPQPVAQAVNYSGVFVVAIIAASIIAGYYIYKKK